MAKVTLSFDSYNATGNREDLTDFITDISPLETPAFSRWGNTRANGRYHEWQCDSLAVASSNVYVEGEAFAAVARTPTSRLNNSCQVMIKMFSITDTQNIVDKAGRNSESAYQMTKAAKELKRDMEWSIMTTSGADAIISGASGYVDVAPRLKGVYFWQFNVKTQTGISGQATVAAI